jgi:predicted dienelactone hydrolase
MTSITLVLLSSLLAQSQGPTTYDPSALVGKPRVVLTEFEYSDRKVPLKFYLPEKKNAAIILLSHGLGGSRNSGTYLGMHWAGRGYVVVAIQHLGSDESVIQEARGVRQKFAALKKAANGKSFDDRCKDVKATLDHLAKLNADGKYAGQFSLSKVGMAGHSFGAVTTQAVSGQNYGRLGSLHTDKRIKAALPLSPSPPALGFNDETFGKVQIPWLTMTGTKDSSPIGRGSGTPENRQKVFTSLPKAGHHYGLILDGAQHLAFGDAKRLNRGRNPAHHVAIKALSSAFWDSYLLDNETAKKWLNGTGPGKVLSEKDDWKRK